ncbi:hypothetical protein RM844_06075 [Streptomyces sp. DSM 44915]|uniref:Uncharacterized protein n=1 Tax=Streptomyces chisholmiae TaxID=3075540 RepID=A0ABU2JLJ4_9ACTN|nr:hypothetical protein [Streptomyces sp. DSM 44915]MDT0265855.1 hypothetical protein [Streptomyces sp. DSM 44915]
MSGKSDDAQALTGLIRWEAPLGELIEAANRCDRRTVPAALLCRSAVRDVLRRCVSGDLALAELPHWAFSVHMMESVEIVEGDLDLLSRFLVEVSSPELFGPVTKDVCEQWSQRMAA